MQDDPVSRLFRKPRLQWQKHELEDAFLAILARYKEAMEGWGSALETCDALVVANKSLTDSLAFRSSQDIAVSDALTTQGRRKRGRPRKHEDLSWIDGWLQDSYRKFGRLNDRPLIRAAFTEMYERFGMRKSRVNSVRVTRQMETFRKLIVERRYQLRRLSKK